MDEVKVIEIKKSIFDENNKDADNLRSDLKKRKIFLLNVMSSPGSGKTTTLIKVINALKEKFKIAVMEADIDSKVDAEMTKQGLDNLDMNQVDLVILENVGNLVCPAEFDTGSVKNIMILSVPEGDDKPLKYPLMFSICDVVLVNKIDVLPYFDFNLENCKEYIKMRNPKTKVMPICAKTGEGIDEFAKWLSTEIIKWKEEE